MSELEERLERLGLSQYFESFVSEGFDTWETLLDITESDFTLGVKLGHRRKLQRTIAESRGQSSDRPLPISLSKANTEGSYRSDDSATESKVRPSESFVTGTAGTSTKRKYRRHPKADEHAPERPPSAYVIFSNQVRETLRGQELSFTEIAKVVGERWQVLPADAREACERQANAAKEKYYAGLAEYKKTAQYAAYQKYLEEFKAKHAAPQKTAEGKRSKLETESSISTRSSSHEQQARGVSTADSDMFGRNQYRSESSPPLGPARIPSGPTPVSKSTSPAGHSLSGVNSPRVPDHYSPLSASPRSATLNRESSYDIHPGPFSREYHRERQSDPNLPFPPPGYGHQHQSSSTTPPSAAYGSHYTAPIDLPSRRSFREPTRLPPLTHEETTVSSEGSVPPYGAPPYQGNFLPIDPSKSMRVLPQPVPSLGPSTSPLDRPAPPSVSSSQAHPDYRTSSNLAALLRAGELAREADDENMDKDGSP
ncbi:hypothetical protein BDV96DRAFT_163868 [Lophiotrema nucula]|uniref:HMG box domain-containing protein n=1 Tax=Lophiotrema nucula TaxID=690887 RepID=A0A6A5YZE2_9PLEO|nr:hypothetical protein BDV96DRAFT_163868 [Lophiotrema nucula]